MTKEQIQELLQKAILEISATHETENEINSRIHLLIDNLTDDNLLKFINHIAEKCIENPATPQVRLFEKIKHIAIEHLYIEITKEVYWQDQKKLNPEIFLNKLFSNESSNLLLSELVGYTMAYGK